MNVWQLSTLFFLFNSNTITFFPRRDIYIHTHTYAMKEENEVERNEVAG